MISPKSFFVRSKWILNNGDINLEIDLFLNEFRDSLESINEKHFFSREMGYQGKLLPELEKRIHIKKIFLGSIIVEQEYQKTLKNHGINIRPDLIIHVPYMDKIHPSRRYGNYVVIQLKLCASEKKAKEDFRKMNLMFNKLDYPLGIFLNINSDKTFFDSYSGDNKERLHCFAVKLSDNKVLIYESP